MRRAPVVLSHGNDSGRELKIWLGIGSVEKLAKSLGILNPCLGSRIEPASTALTLSILCRPQPIPLSTAPIGWYRLRQVSGDPGSLKNAFVPSFTSAIRRPHLSPEPRDYRLHTPRRVQALADVPMSGPFVNW